jgi:hypothetical protein
MHQVSRSEPPFTAYQSEENADPSDEFIQRFAEYKPPVRKISECNVGPFDGVVDKRTHKLGLVFRVGSIKWISGTEVEACGGYYEAGLSASGNTYSVRKRLVKWRVTGDKMNWISENRRAIPSLAVAKSSFHSFTHNRLNEVKSRGGATV